ncbi:MAG: type I glyceraldehyde-3-phosphate dehydrogenase [Anaerolineae bacterium]
MTKRVAINGFGRTGRQALKTIWYQHRDTLQIAAIGLEDMEDVPAAAHLLKHDSNYGRFDAPVSVADSELSVGDWRIPLVAAERLEDLPWADLGIDIVLEASGAFMGGRSAAGHIEAGARKVVITAESDTADFTMIYGVNEDEYDPRKHHVVSADTETTNALAVVLRAMLSGYEIENAVVSAVRAYTNTQKLIDSTDSDLRRARSAPTSIVPTRSRATTAVADVVPEVAGRIRGYAVRVPVPVVSILELTLQLSSEATADAINEVIREAAAGPLGRVLAVSEDELVSTDFRRSEYSAVLDAPSTMTNGRLAKLSAWYDNEWGYSSRVGDVADVIAERG